MSKQYIVTVFDDAKEVVRCENCKYYSMNLRKQDKRYKLFRCIYHNCDTKAKNYCSWGETE